MKPSLRSDVDVGHLVRGRLQRPGASGEVCPDAEVLAAYVDGGLSAVEVDRVDGHLAACATCRATLARLSPTEVESPLVGVFGRLPRIDPKWLSLAAMVIVSVAVWGAWPRSTAGPPASSLARVTDREAPAPQRVESVRGQPPPSQLAKEDAKNARTEGLLVAGKLAEERLTPEKLAQEKLARQTRVGSVAQSPAPLAVDKKRQDAASVPSPPTDASRLGPRPAAALPSGGPAPAAPVATAARPASNSQGASPESGDNLRRKGAEPAAPAEAALTAAAPPPSPAASRPAQPIVPPPASALETRRAPNADAERDARAAAGRSPAGAAGTVADSPKLTTADAVDVVGNRQRTAGSVVRTAAGGSEFSDPEGRLRFRIADAGRRIESSSDAGTSWNPSFRDPEVRLWVGSAPDMNSAWAAGARGVVVRRLVPGSWVRVASPTNEDLLVIVASSATAAFVTTRSGQVYETSDGGATWSPR